jgi:hypothetical protein
VKSVRFIVVCDVTHLSSPPLLLEPIKIIRNEPIEMLFKLGDSCGSLYNEHWDIDSPEYGRSDTVKQLAFEIRPAMPFLVPTSHP